MVNRARSLAADQDRHFDERAATWADRYRSHPSFRARLAVVGNAVDDELAGRPDARVLDYGGGPGLFAELAAQRATEVVCIDRSPSMIEWGQQHRSELGSLLAEAGFARAPGDVRRQVGDEQSLPARGSFDVILAIAVLEYVGDPVGVIGALATALRPGGTLLATVPNPRSPVRWAQRIAGPVAAVTTGRPGRIADQSFATIRPHGDRVPWSRAASAAGLDVTATTPVPLGDRGSRTWLHPNTLISLRASGDECEGLRHG